MKPFPFPGRVASVEPLPPRRLMAAVALYSTGTLAVTGTAADDNVVISLNSPFDGQVSVVANGQAFSFDRSKIKRITAALGHGDNVFQSTVHVRTIVLAGRGNDRIATGEKDDEVNSGDGRDVILTRSGVDKIAFGRGDKSINAGANDSVIRKTVDTTDGTINITVGSVARSDIRISAHAAYLYLGGISAYASVNTVGNSRLDARAVEEGATLIGGAGNDLILGSPGDDLLLGGDGRDTLRGALGRDSLYGQAGSDFLVGGSGAADVINGGNGRERAWVDEDDKLIDVELISYDGVTYE